LVILCVSDEVLGDAAGSQKRELWNSGLTKCQAGRPTCARTNFHRGILVDNFRTALREQGDGRKGWQTAVGGVADQLLILLARSFCEPRATHQSSSAQLIEGVIAYVDTHVHEALRIDTMAEQCALSPRRFTDLFKSETGSTFNAYLTRKRIEFACRRLEETGHILYACHESGFNDPGYFYRVFKKVTGRTPGQYLAEEKSRG